MSTKSRGHTLPAFKNYYLIQQRSLYITDEQKKFWYMSLLFLFCLTPSQKWKYQPTFIVELYSLV